MNGHLDDFGAFWYQSDQNGAKTDQKIDEKCDRKHIEKSSKKVPKIIKKESQHLSNIHEKTFPRRRRRRAKKNIEKGACERDLRSKS